MGPEMNPFMGPEMSPIRGPQMTTFMGPQMSPIDASSLADPETLERGAKKHEI